MKKRWKTCLGFLMFLCSFFIGGNRMDGGFWATVSAAGSQAEPVYEYETEELYAEREDHQIYGVIYIPQGAGDKMPAVIFSHGYGGNHQVGASYAESLAEQADLEAVITMMQGLDYVDSDNLFLMGTSQGGAVSAITGAAHPEEICGMVLLYPAFVMVDNAKELFQSVDEIPDTYDFMWMEVGRAYFEPLLDYDIYGEIAAYDKDVLLIHGAEDGIVPLSYSEQALEVYPSAELKVIEGAGHGFYGDDEILATQEILAYLDAHRS